METKHILAGIGGLGALYLIQRTRAHIPPKPPEPPDPSEWICNEPKTGWANDQYGNTTFLERCLPTPTTGILQVNTTPVKAEVKVSGEVWGTAPQSREMPSEDYLVAFGDVVGYDPPPCIQVTVLPGQTKGVTGIYSKSSAPPEPPGPEGIGQIISMNTDKTSAKLSENVTITATIRNDGGRDKLLMQCGFIDQTGKVIDRSAVILEILGVGQQKTKSFPYRVPANYSHDTITAYAVGYHDDFGWVQDSILKREISVIPESIFPDPWEYRGITVSFWQRMMVPYWKFIFEGVIYENPSWTINRKDLVRAKIDELIETWAPLTIEEMIEFATERIKFEDMLPENEQMYINRAIAWIYAHPTATREELVYYLQRLY